MRQMDYVRSVKTPFRMRSWDWSRAVSVPRNITWASDGLGTLDCAAKTPLCQRIETSCGRYSDPVSGVARDPGRRLHRGCGLYRKQKRCRVGLPK